jgi:hypothetical protein
VRLRQEIGLNTALSTTTTTTTTTHRQEAGTSRFVKVLAMLLMPVLVMAVISCGDNSGDNSTENRVPYAGVPEGKPTGSTSTIPDPKEAVETKPAGQLPDFVKNMTGSNKETTMTLYQGAVDHHDAYSHIPCYCGCAAYATPHKSLAECFIKEKAANGELTFTDHSLTCSLCQSAAQMTLEGQSKGTPLKETRMTIFEKLKYTGTWTDTPPVP